ncbi:MAG: hypothetical protein WBD22_12405 [Pyrinomonadaceae bacterium]
MKIIGLAVLALLLGVGVYVWKTEIGDDEIFVLPEGYRGVVLIFYDQKEGEPKKYERGKRVYKIPRSGILKTQFSHDEGWQHFGEYFYDGNGQLARIPYVRDGRDTESNRAIGFNEIYACCSSVGQSYSDNSNRSVVFGQFYVGTKEEIKMAGEQREKINPIDLLN